MVLIKSSRATSIFAEDLLADSARGVDILPSTFKVEVENLEAKTDSGIFSISQNIDSTVQLKASVAAAGATTLKVETANLILNSFDIPLLATAGGGSDPDNVTFSGNNVTFKTAAPAPSSIIGASIRVNYSGAFSVAPLYYVTGVSGSDITCAGQAYGATTALKLVNGSVSVFGHKAIQLNAPAYLGKITVTGSTVKIIGGFPTEPLGSALSIPSRGAYVKASRRGTGESLKVSIIAYDKATNEVTVDGDDAKQLMSYTASSTVPMISASIVNIEGFSKLSYLDADEYFQHSLKSRINLADFGSNRVRVIQYISG